MEPATGNGSSKQPAQLASPRSEVAAPRKDEEPQEEEGLETETKSPPATQVMERVGGDVSPNPEVECDPNRIPAHVFARTNTSTPVEWSTCSNESLFSIHMGNMSFARENWLGNDILGDESQFADVDFSSNQPPSNQQSPLPSRVPSMPGVHDDDGLSETTIGNLAHVSQELSLPRTDPLANHAMPVSPQRSSTSSNNSHSSIKSFAFPILTGGMDNGADKSGSISVTGNEKRKKKSHSILHLPKLNLNLKPESRSHSPSQSQRQQQHQTSNSQTPKGTPKGTPNGTSTSKTVHAKWYSCFSCCTFCS